MKKIKVLRITGWSELRTSVEVAGPVLGRQRRKEEPDEGVDAADERVHLGDGMRQEAGVGADADVRRPVDVDQVAHHPAQRMPFALQRLRKNPAVRKHGQLHWFHSSDDGYLLQVLLELTVLGHVETSATVVGNAL